MKKKWMYGLATALVAGVFAMLPCGARAEGGVAIDENNFPDEKFRSYVTRFDTGGDGALSSEELAAVTTIDVSYSDIDRLAGIEYFTSLKELDCRQNWLEKLDVSRNTSLSELYCSNCFLRKLDVSKNTSLTLLDCWNNYLEELDVSKNTSLEYLFCGGNLLTELDVSKNTSLKNLTCEENSLKELDVSKNTRLDQLNAYGNGMTTLVLGENTELSTLYQQGRKETKKESAHDKTWDVTYYYPNSGSASMVLDRDVSVAISRAGEWKQDKAGWWYRFTDGTYPKDKWVPIDGSWYYFKADGYMAADEWCKGYYFNKDGTWTYQATATWKHDKNGYWYQDTTGWYPKNQWQKIDGQWYYFKAKGYMASNEYCKGYYFNKDGTWTYKAVASWKKDSRGWYYSDTKGWYAKNCTLTIDGKKYNFNAAGYCTNP